MILDRLKELISNTPREELIRSWENFADYAKESPTMDDLFSSWQQQDLLSGRPPDRLAPIPRPTFQLAIEDSLFVESFFCDKFGND